MIVVLKTIISLRKRCEIFDLNGRHNYYR